MSYMFGPKPKHMRIVDKGTILWVKNRRDGCCLYNLEVQDKDDPCNGPLDPHHIRSVSVGGDDVEKNIITLCRKHHMDAQERRIKPIFLRRILEKRYGYEYTEAELEQK